MGKDTSPYVVGDFWLDRRPDNASPFWQIAWYDAGTRTTRYRSTRRRDIGQAKRALDAFFLEKNTAKTEEPTEASVAMLMLEYLEQHGPDIIGKGQSESSLRQWYAFLKHDSVGVSAKVSDMTPVVVARFMRWRMKPHSYKLRWRGKDYAHTSKGVRGESVQRNIEDLRAALNHARKNGRVTLVPHLPSVPEKHRSQPRDRVLSMKEMGAILNYAADDLPLLRMVLGIMGTLARPEAVLAWDIKSQADFGRGLIDTHPPGKPHTKKVNPIVPIAPFLLPWLQACSGKWIVRNGKQVKSMKTALRTMRRELGLGQDVVFKTIRHTVITYLYEHGIPEGQIEVMAGHAGARRKSTTRKHYAHLQPGYLKDAIKGIESYARALANHSKAHVALRTICGPEGRNMVVLERQKA